MKHEYNEIISKFLKEFDCEVVEVTRTSGYEINENTLYIWGFNDSPDYGNICELLKQNPFTDTLYIGKNITDNNDIIKIHHLLQTSHNIIPVIKNIIVEDDSRFYSKDGLLIDKLSNTVIDYASGRSNTVVVIPNRITGIAEDCFHYNEYVKQIVLPSSIEGIEGITSLPKLENVIVNNGYDNHYTTLNGVIFIKGIVFPYFIPPYNPLFPNADKLKKHFDDLLSLVKSEATIGRWKDVDPECFATYPIADERICLTYNGGFYQQTWSVDLQLMPTRIIFGYNFDGDWDTECVLRLLENEDISLISCPIKLNCKECKFKHNCDGIYYSNEKYVSKLANKLKNSIICDLSIIDNRNIKFEVCIDTSMQTISHFFLDFLDIALDYRIKYPIMERPLQLTLFNEMECQSEMNSNSSENFPFNHSYSSAPIGFLKSDTEYEDKDEEVPF